MRSRAAAAALATLLLAAAPAAAAGGKGEYVGQWSLSGGLGYAVPSTDEYAGGLAWRVAVGYSPVPSLELLVEYAGWESQVTQPDANGIPSHTIASGDLAIHPLTLTAQWRLPLPEFAATAFLLGGVGWYTIDYTMSAEARRVYEDSGAVGLPDQSVDSTWGWHAGAGLEYPLTDRVSLTGEGRYVFLSPEAGGATTPGNRISGSLDLDTWLLSAGVKVAF